MKQIFPLLVLALIFVGCAPVEKKDFVVIKPTPANAAWWLRAEYFPSEKNIRGISIVSFKKDWCAAGEFTKEEHFKHLSPIEKQEFDPHSDFSVFGKFNGKDEMEIVSGVYQKCSGDMGNFLLSLARDGDKAARVVSVMELNSGQPGFMALSEAAPDQVRLWWCFDCDSSGLVKWDEKTNNFLLIENDASEEEK